MRAVIACTNEKGGCGKTSLAVNLAAALGEAKKRTRLLDLDPQESAGRWAAQAKEVGTPCPDKFDLRHDVSKYDLSEIKEKQQSEALRREIERLLEGIDVLVIDTPPGLGNAALLAAYHADLVMVPVSPSPLDMWAAEKAIETARHARELRNDGRPLVSLIPSRLMKTTTISRDLTGVLEGMGEPVGPGITNRVAVAEAVIAGQTVQTYAPGGPSHLEFKTLAKHCLMRLKK